MLHKCFKKKKRLNTDVDETLCNKFKIVDLEPPSSRPSRLHHTSYVKEVIWKCKSTRDYENNAAVRTRTLPYAHRTGRQSDPMYIWRIFYHSLARSPPISDRERSILRVGPLS